MSTENVERSRFGYFGDEPTEGGVHQVMERGQGVRPTTPGVPGPEEKRLDISELVRNTGMRYTHEFRLPPTIQPDFTTTAPIIGEVTLTNAGGILHLHGNASTLILMECGRCLEPVEVPVSATIEENFDLVTTNNAYHQEEVKAVDEDTPAAVISGNVLDLADLLRQTLVLEAPYQPICREDCPGVVPGAFIPATDDVALLPAPEPVAETQQPFRNLAALLAAQQGE